MTNSPTVDILLGTWNGEKFLAEQIDSIINQSFTEWRLVVRDDGSTDATPELLSNYATKLGRRMVLIKDGLGNQGAAANFSILMEHTEAPYAMFCDQDDVWLPAKIERSLAAITEIEELYGSETPLLVHSDLQVVDADLREIAPSFWRYRRVDPVQERELRRLLLRNIVTGCASIMNRRLVTLAFPIPNLARMHDAWVAQVAAACGKIGSVAEPLVLYRQHGKNLQGVTAGTLISMATRFMLSPLERISNIRQVFCDAQYQASVLLSRYLTEISDENKKIITSFVNLKNHNFFYRRIELINSGVLYCSYVRNTVLLFVV